MLPIRTDIEAYLAAKKEKALLDSRSRILETKIKALGENFERAIATHGSAAGELKTAGHRLWLAPGQKRPNWKGHFIDAKGPDAAQAIMEKTEPSTVLHVEPMR